MHIFSKGGVHKIVLKYFIFIFIDNIEINSKNGPGLEYEELKKINLYIKNYLNIYII